MSERQKQDSEKMLISNILIGVVLFIIIGVSLIPNPPRIIIADSNRLSVQDTEVELPRKDAPSSDPVRRSLGIFVVTAYCPCKKCCGDYADGITASGVPAIGKFVAADKIIPFYKVLDIPEYGEVEVLDRGGKIRGKTLDVFFDIHEEALIWGRQELEIFCWVEGE